MPLQIIRNDITTMPVDAIVNAAKESLLGGGGVDGCIHRAAGPELLAECRTLGGCRTGDAKITKGYRLPCKYVIHTVGPVWYGGTCGEREKLVSCYRKSLALAKEYHCESVAFPLISAGVFGYPREQALQVAVDSVSKFLADNDMTVYIVTFGRSATRAAQTLFPGLSDYIDDHYTEVHGMPRTLGNAGPDSLAGSLDPADLHAPYPQPVYKKAATEESLGELMENLDAGFSETLFKLIDRTGKTDTEVYKKANIDRKLFSKIRNNANYKPSKSTAVALAVALELDLDETRDFIARAGFALSRSSKFDVIIEYFLSHGKYNIYEINEALFAFDQPLLGS